VSLEKNQSRGFACRLLCPASGGRAMSQQMPCRSHSTLAVCLALLAAFGGGAMSSAAWATEGALKILSSMADHLTKERNLSVKYDSDIEIVTADLQKIQFSASGEVTFARPDKFRITRTGGYADVELVSDGKTFSVHDRGGNRFAQVPAAGSFDQLVDKLRTEVMLEIAGADLLLSKPFEELTAGVIEAKHIGRGVVEGVECEHLAFRNLDTDWQIWVEVGERPFPRKYLITSKTVAAAPQYTLRLKDWQTGAEPAPDAFKFVPSANASGVTVTDLTDIDEIPAGVVPGGTK
jgi:hypothetical protein